MEETQDDIGPEIPVAPTATWWHPDFLEKLQSMSLVSSKESLDCKELNTEHELEGLAARRASQILWATGKLAKPIPNGFYSVVPERRLKEYFEIIPSLDELYALGSEGVRLEVILVDTHKDKKLSMLKQLALTLGKGFDSNPAAVIKKIAGLVSDFYKRPSTVPSDVKDALEEVSLEFDNRGVQMLGQIRRGSCHARAILFKVLADSVGLDSRLMVGLPREGVMERTDSHKHMSVIIVLNFMELLVDLVRSPGKLIPYSTKAIFMSHISVTGESDSAENDSCDSPLEPNSPLCASSDQVDAEGSEHYESLQTSYRIKLEASMNASGPSLRNIISRSNTMVKEKLNLSHSEPYIANAFWGRSQKKVIVEQETSNSSPEHLLFRGHRRSILGGRRDSTKEYMTASRSAGASPVETRRRRRRCISMIPEIGDDIVRVVRAMNETLKQNRLPRERIDDLTGVPTSEKYNDPNFQGNVTDLRLDHDEISGDKSTSYILQKKQFSSEKAISLPSSPHHFRSHASGSGEAKEFLGSANVTSAWNIALDSSKILNNQLFPFKEWNIDFSELNYGPRIGIGFFGEVFRGIWNGTEVAIKVLLEQGLTVENIEDFCNEISILSRLRHPNVILFLGACTSPPRLSMVTEFMDMGSLYYLIHVSGQKKRLSWRRRLEMLCDICRGLMSIHRMKVAHRDLKSANCLVNKRWTVKICDFGLSRVLTTRPMRDSSSAGTPEWMAPELIRHDPFTEKCDIFSLGVIIWELYTLNRPWEGVPSVQVVYAVANDGLRLEIPEGPLGELIADCWAEPEERPSCEEILSRLQNCEYTLC
ncbi:hypothetical protein RJ639_017500 [Escallonia herrerae]|uniref:non-specific serine/threonine protein kinase n=1 Tax=Escallonia herrerae TaxID=1293975 RepID=A0AA89AKE7_9ASTE|nr:hypothetical protein RJ639_017500 [Escallonia herrerae]